jgi:hypothetical protein
MDESPGEGEGGERGNEREREAVRERIKNNMHVSEIYFFGVLVFIKGLILQILQVLQILSKFQDVD